MAGGDSMVAGGRHGGWNREHVAEADWKQHEF